MSSGPQSSASTPLICMAFTRRAAISICAGVCGDVEDAALAQHHVEVEIARQALVEPEGQIVERDRFGIEIVRADDRRVSAGVAAADPAFFDDRDAAAPVGLAR